MSVTLIWILSPCTRHGRSLNTARPWCYGRCCIFHPHRAPCACRARIHLRNAVHPELERKDKNWWYYHMYDLWLSLTDILSNQSLKLHYVAYLNLTAKYWMLLRIAIFEWGDKLLCLSPIRRLPRKRWRRSKAFHFTRNLWYFIYFYLTAAYFDGSDWWSLNIANIVCKNKIGRSGKKIGRRTSGGA